MKAFPLMVVRPSGSWMLSRLLQLLNAPPPIIVRLLFSANSASVRLMQPQNALFVSFVTPAPITTFVIIVR